MSSVAIIVPYREQTNQNRTRELCAFTAHMKHMMNLLISEHKIKTYHIYVIEQSDGKKFNRGLLLNIGAHFANKSHDILIFHDVDLIPEIDLRYWYSDKPRKKHPIHIASCWKDRYTGSSYFGGIVSFRREDFQTINGFPNSFWGWGGEDDALRERCRRNDFGIEPVREGKIYDMETDSEGLSMDLSQKLCHLKTYPEWKCDDKWEQRYIDREIWDKNGLNQISSLYQVDDWETIDFLTKIQVRV